MKLLDGIRVLDLTNVLAGPFATLHLALAGAEVVKIENPEGGDLARKLGNVPELNQQLMGTSFLAQNTNKKSLTLNLKEPAAKEIFAKLVATADVLVENFRPGVLARLGFPWEKLHEMNPRLIYCAISGFGQTGPDADKPAPGRSAANPETGRLCSYLPRCSNPRPACRYCRLTSMAGIERGLPVWRGTSD